MKRFKKSILSMIIVASLLVTSLCFSVFAESNNNYVIEVTRENAIREIKDLSQKETIHLLGDIEFSTDLVNKKHIKNIEDFTLSDNTNSTNSLFISLDNSSNVLNNVSELKKLLKKGVSVYFIGFSDSNALRKTFVNANYEKKVINDDADFQVVTQNKNGEYYFGHGYFEGLTQAEIEEALVSSVWNRRNDITSVAPISKKKEKSILTSLSIIPNAHASGSDFYSFDSAWTDWGWDYEDCYSTFGDTREWWKLLHYNDGYDDYYAIASSFQMNPKTNCSSSFLITEYDGDYYQNDTALFQYAPLTEPQTNTFSFNIGVGGDGDDYEASIEASWDVTINNLDYNTVGTNTTNDYYKGTFDYQEGSIYALGSSVQNVSAIFQRDSGTYCEFWQKHESYYLTHYTYDVSTVSKTYKVTINE